ncbi:MAG: hypothetical protein GQ534_06700 [Candidatus Delongbacteria bacterium]|nr:hypothetical protein [Candidatus Delongbacteria bacterium]
MNKTVYILQKFKDSQEFHLFEGKIDDENNICSSKTGKSICGKVKLDANAKCEFVCEDEDHSRYKCYLLEKKVCGTCVSHLYGKFE